MSELQGALRVLSMKYKEEPGYALFCKSKFGTLQKALISLSGYITNR